MLFEHLSLSKSIQRALVKVNYTEATPVQEKVIPEVLRRNDVIGVAQTGTGKTGAYTIPIVNLLHKFAKKPGEKKVLKALVIAPTRELAVQINENFRGYSQYTDLRSAVVFGGASIQPQKELVRKGIDILVATPGRLLDLRKQGTLDLDSLEILVIDEADLMLEMGFIEDVRKIIRLAHNLEQRLLFSATFSPEISLLADSFLENPQLIEISTGTTSAEGIAQEVYFTDKADKNELLLYLLRNLIKKDSLLIFRRTKIGVEKTLETLTRNNFRAEAIHGDKSQSARQSALNALKNREVGILIATDVAARGLDIKGLDYVLNFDLPSKPEIYIHRIGRTARAGKTGISISFCSPEEKQYLQEIEKLTGEKISVQENNPYPLERDAKPQKHVKRGSKYKKSRKGAGSKAKKKRWY